MSVAQSQGGVMHFKSQHALIVKPKRLAAVEGLDLSCGTPGEASA
jgi:hypothetical protein